MPYQRGKLSCTAGGSPLREGAVATHSFVSPERRWRAAFMVPVASFFGWRAFVHLGPVAGALVAAGLLAGSFLESPRRTAPAVLDPRGTPGHRRREPAVRSVADQPVPPHRQRRPSLRSPPAPGWYSRP